MQHITARLLTTAYLALTFGVSISTTRAGGTVVAWGDYWDITTIGAETYRPMSVPPGLNNVVAIAAGIDHALALKADGTVVAWGSNWRGANNVPPGLSNVVAIACGWSHSLALKADGTVVTWGTSMGESLPPGLTNVIAVGARAGSVALKDDGTLAYWGGTTNPPPGLSNLVALAESYDDGTVLALKSDGALVGWSYFQSSSLTNFPSGLTNTVAIGAGFLHAVALKSDGTVTAWGGSSRGEANVPADLTHVIAISAGEFHSIALREDGTVVPWGSYNYYGNVYPANAPAGLTNVVAVAAGSTFDVVLVDQPLSPGETASDIRKTPAGFGFWIPTRTGRLYELEYKTAVDSNAWHFLSLMAGTGKLVNIVDISTGDSNRFYRVRQW